MLTLCDIDSKLVSMAEAVRAEHAYDVSMKIDDFQFYSLYQQKVYVQEQELNKILYNQVQFNVLR